MLPEPIFSLFFIFTQVSKKISHGNSFLELGSGGKGL